MHGNPNLDTCIGNGHMHTHARTPLTGGPHVRSRVCRAGAPSPRHRLASAAAWGSMSPATRSPCEASQEGANAHSPSGASCAREMRPRRLPPRRSALVPERARFPSHAPWWRGPPADSSTVNPCPRKMPRVRPRKRPANAFAAKSASAARRPHFRGSRGEAFTAWARPRSTPRL